MVHNNFSIGKFGVIMKKKNGKLLLKHSYTTKSVFTILNLLRSTGPI